MCVCVGDRIQESLRGTIAHKYIYYTNFNDLVMFFCYVCCHLAKSVDFSVNSYFMYIFQTKKLKVCLCNDRMFER